MSRARWLALALAGAAAGLAGCDHAHHHGDAAHDHHAGGPGHGHGDPAHDHGPGDGEPGRPDVAITHFTDRSELFVEFPALVAGLESRFLAHVTELPGFRPALAGRVEVVLSGGGAPDERFAAGEPARPGIFAPVARPSRPGDRQLAIVFHGPGGPDRHELGTHRVHESAAAARAAAGEPEDDTGHIRFLKEQQWETGFALALAAERPLRGWIEATGRLRPRAGGDALVTAPAAGRVSSAGAAGTVPAPGDAVRADQPLLALDRFPGDGSDLASLEQARDRARLELELALRERDRLEPLYRAEAIPERRLAEAQHRARAAQVDLAAAERRLEQHARVQRPGGPASPDRILLRAPIAGTVVESRIAPGAAVAPGEELVRIVDLSTLWLEVRIPEAHVAQVQRARAAAFRVPGSDREIEVGAPGAGRLVSLGALLDPESRTLPLLFEVPNPDRELRAGMSARVRVFTGPVVDALAVPASAVLDDAGKPVVYVQAGGESFERRVVELGLRDGAHVEIRSGIAPGERVVSAGAYEVRLAAVSIAVPAHGHAH